MDDNFAEYLEKIKKLSPEEKEKIKERLYQGAGLPKPTTPPKNETSILERIISWIKLRF
jgi:DNA-directed RNA polymerase subunit F